MRPKFCICDPGDPCDYHAASCTVCPDRKCQGHPYQDRLNRYLAALQNEIAPNDDRERFAVAGVIEYD